MGPDPIIEPNWAVAIPLFLAALVVGLLVGKALAGKDPIDKWKPEKRRPRQRS